MNVWINHICIKLENENKEKFIIITTNILSHMTIGHENIILESKHTIFFWRRHTQNILTITSIQSFGG